MPQFWRISNHHSLSGEGGLKYAARWHSAGSRIVYLAETPAGALIEVLVHLELTVDVWPRSYNLMLVEADDDIPIETLVVPPGDDWKLSTDVTRTIGDEWLRSGRTSLGRVPSAILPSTWNYLLNPLHPEASLVRIIEEHLVDFDDRLLRFIKKT
jgi:RES domain-containing protein